MTEPVVLAEPTVVVVSDLTTSVVEVEPSIVVTDSASTSVVTTSGDVIVLDGTGVQGVPGEQGIQGPPGIQGPAGTTDSVQFTVMAGFNISAYQVICPRISDASVRLASNDGPTDSNRPMWLALQSALATETLTALSTGRVDNSSWNWVQAAIYLGDDGSMTQTPPSSDDGALFSLQLGYAISATSMFFDRFTPIILAEA